MRLGRDQIRLLVALYKREEEEYVWWKAVDALPLAGIDTAFADGGDGSRRKVKNFSPSRTAPWPAIIHRLNPKGDSRLGNNLARAADSLERHGLVWLEPPRTTRHRRRATCGLTDHGRAEAARRVARDAGEHNQPEDRTETYGSDLVAPYYRLWQQRRTKLEAQMSDSNFVTQASDHELAAFSRALHQARVVLEFVKRVLPEIAETHATPDPPHGSTAVLTLSGNIGPSPGPVKAETIEILNTIVRDVIEQADARKRAQRASRILNKALEPTED